MTQVSDVVVHNIFQAIYSLVQILPTFASPPKSSKEAMMPATPDKGGHSGVEGTAFQCQLNCSIQRKEIYSPLYV